MTRLRMLLLVIAGGAVGTSLRAWLEAAIVSPHGSWPIATFGINLTGSFLLGLLQESLLLGGPDGGWRAVLRLAVGTGVIGGFTTYSTFILEVDSLLGGGAVPVGLAYAVTSLVLGIGGALLGVVVARRLSGAGLGGAR